MKKITWIKPNKTKIETNDQPATIKHCEDLGWKREPVRKIKKATAE